MTYSTPQMIVTARLLVLLFDYPVIKTVSPVITQQMVVEAISTMATVPVSNIQEDVYSGFEGISEFSKATFVVGFPPQRDEAPKKVTLAKA